MSYYIFVKDGFKEFHHFIRTEGRIYDITNCSILTDGHIDGNDGLVPDAIPVSDSYVAKLLAKSKSKPRRKAFKMKRLQKKEAVN